MPGKIHPENLITKARSCQTGRSGLSPRQRSDKLVFIGLCPDYLSLRDQSA